MEGLKRLDRCDGGNTFEGIGVIGGRELHLVSRVQGNMIRLLFAKGYANSPMRE